jgi:hypothetical protein
MTRNAPADRILDTEPVNTLARIVEEATRSTREGAKRFVEPAEGTLGRAKSRRHHIVFGRRGSGKSSLLTKAAAELTVDRCPIVFVDLEEFKGHTYPDVLISVLIRALGEFETWLKTAAINPGNKKSFWDKLFGAVPRRPALKKTPVADLNATLGQLLTELKTLLYQPDDSERSIRSETSVEDKVGVSAGVSAGAMGSKTCLKAEASSGQSTKESMETKYSHQKIAVLQRNILKYKDFFNSLSKISDGPSFLMFDDLYHIPRRDQAHLLDYFHRIAKGSNLWLKVGTIRHRTRWYVSGDPPTGMKLGDDADEIDLDVTLEKYDLTKRFLLRILEGLSHSAMSIYNPYSQKVREIRLVLASGGVARDFLTIFRRSIDIARERLQGRGVLNRGTKIGAEDVNLAAGEYDKFKREDFERDTQSTDRDELLGTLSTVSTFCLQKSNTNCLLLLKDAAGEFAYNIHELVDLKFLHQVRSRVTVRDEPGQLYEAYMLDLSQYTGERKRRGLDMVEFWKAEASDTLRRRSLILDP